MAGQPWINYPGLGRSADKAGHVAEMTSRKMLNEVIQDWFFRVKCNMSIPDLRGSLFRKVRYFHYQKAQKTCSKLSYSAGRSTVAINAQLSSNGDKRVYQSTQDWLTKPTRLTGATAHLYLWNRCSRVIRKKYLRLWCECFIKLFKVLWHKMNKI